MLPPDAIALLARHPVFAALPADALVELANASTWQGLPGGRTLYRRGDPADSLYFLRHGSLGVFDGPTQLRRLIPAGGSVGEISLLAGDHRHHSVRALRDCDLLRLDRAAFERFAQRHPQALLAWSRLSLGQLLHGDDRRPTPARSFAILPADANVPARSLALRLAMALEGHGRCLLLDAATGTGRSADWFAEREAEHSFVLYLDEAGEDEEWRQRCLRQADVLLLPTRAAAAAHAWPEPRLAHPAWLRHRRRHLILLHPGHDVGLGAARRWLAQFSGELEHHHVRHDSDIERLARLVSGRGRGLVLAGGGARGLAHLGALRALAEAGHEFDAIGGTSIGAIIGAGIAAEWPLDALIEMLRRNFVHGRPLADWTLPMVALTRGARASRLLRQTFGALAIEDLPRRFFCVSTDLSGPGQVAHRHGPLWLWLRASSAIPGILPPVFQHGGVHVDGALVDNLPTDVMADAHIAHITALDVRADIHLRSPIDEAATPLPWRVWWQHRRGPRRPSLTATLVRAAMINGEEASARRRALADLLLSPPLEHIGMLDWKAWRQAIDSGYRHTIERLEECARLRSKIAVDPES